MFKNGVLVLVIGLLFITGCKEEKAPVIEEVKPITQSTIYYFHGNARCMSCHKIESYTREAYNESFKDIFDFNIVNIDDDSNKHFIQDYQLYTKSVVLVKVEDGKEIGYKNLDLIWSNLGDKENFKIYVKNEIEQFLLGEG